MTSFSKIYKSEGSKTFAELSSYDSAGDYANAIDATRGQTTYIDQDAPRDFSGNVTGVEALDMLRNGERAGVAKADKLLSEMDDLINFATTGFKTMNTVAGGAPVVPNVLAGIPQNMRVRRRVDAQRNPLAVFVNLGATWQTEASDLHKRGVATLALVRALSIIRPVNLYLISAAKYDGIDSVHLIPVDTAPLDTGRAAYMLTNVSMMRILAFHSYAVAAQKRGKNGIDGSIPQLFGGEEWDKEKLGNALAKRLGYSEHLYIPRAYMKDDNIKNPTKWLHEQIEIFGSATLAA